MNHFLQAVGMIAALDIGGESRDAHGRRRRFTVEELDDLADFGWHVPDLNGAIAACVRVVRSYLRPRGSSHLAPPTLPPSAATLQR
jgi:hypothetical protein